MLIFIASGSIFIVTRTVEKKMRTQKPYKNLKTVWPVIFLFVVSVVLAYHRPVHADEATENQMRELVKTAGLPPEAIINPPQPVTFKLSIQERFRRFWNDKIFGFRITYASARGKACHANQRVLAGAVEMYNADKGNTMKTLRHADVVSPAGELIKSYYLKSPIMLPEVNCEYCSYGDLADTGIIYCTQHGALEDYRNALVRVTGLRPHSAVVDDELSFAVTIIAIFLLFSIIVVLAPYIKRQKPTADSHQE